VISQVVGVLLVLLGILGLLSNFFGGPFANLFGNPPLDVIYLITGLALLFAAFTFRNVRLVLVLVLLALFYALLSVLQILNIAIPFPNWLYFPPGAWWLHLAIAALLLLAAFVARIGSDTTASVGSVAPGQGSSFHSPIPGASPGQDNPGGRRQWFRRSRIGPDGKLIRGQIAKASTQRRLLEKQIYIQWKEQGAGGWRGPRPGPFDKPFKLGINWTPLGPSAVAHGQASTYPVVSGRITAIAVGPNGGRVYAGAANGGLWFSGDGGLTWIPLDDYATSPSHSTGLQSDSLSVGALAVLFGPTAAADQVFVGTGEPISPDGYWGIGIKYSNNGGATWTLEATNLAGQDIYRIVIDPDDPTVVFAATTNGIYKRPTSSPYTPWQQITDAHFTSSSGYVSDLIIVGSGAAKTYYAAFHWDTIYSSTNQGGSWNPVNGFSPPRVGRIVLAAGENDPSVVYALAQIQSVPAVAATATTPATPFVPSFGQLFRLDSQTSGSFQQVAGVPNALFLGGQGWYDIVLAADPGDANTIYMAGDLTWDNE
jgi:hypothetical protein